MQIGEVAARARIRPSAIRYYERIGVLPRPARASGRRVYDETVLDHLSVIGAARAAGFTIREIRTLFTDGAPVSNRWKTLAAKKLAELEEAEARIRAVRRVVEELGSCECVDLRECGRLVNEEERP